MCTEFKKEKYINMKCLVEKITCVSCKHTSGPWYIHCKCNKKKIDVALLASLVYPPYTISLVIEFVVYMCIIYTINAVDYGTFYLISAYLLYEDRPCVDKIIIAKTITTKV